jgi:hypothetical protein
MGFLVYLVISREQNAKPEAMKKAEGKGDRLTRYYLMVHSPNNGGKTSFELIRLVVGSSKTAKQAREAYERELNNGITYREAVDKVTSKQLDVSILQNFKSVTEIPYNQARDYSSFWSWKVNEDIKNT